MRFSRFLFLPLCNSLFHKNILPNKFKKVKCWQDRSVARSHMENNNENDFNRGIMNDVKQISLPLLVIWLSDPLLSLIDTMSIGKVSSVIDLASLGPATSLCNTGGNILSFISVVTTCRAAKAFSDKDYLKMKYILNDAFIVSFLCGSVISLLMFSSVGNFILNVFLGNPDTLSEATMLVPGAMKYIKIRVFGYIPSLMSSQIQSYALAKRNIIFPLKTVFLATVINIITDYIFVIKYNFGLAGAAWATVISQLITFLYMVFNLPTENNIHCNRRQFKTKFKDVIYFFKRCLGPALANIGRAGILIMTSSCSSCCGTIAAAAHQVMISWLHLFCPIGEAVSQTVMNLLPSYMSRKNQTFTPKTWLFVNTMGKITLFFGILNAFSVSIPMFFSSMFTTSNEVSNLMYSLCPYLSIALFGHALSCFFEGILVSTGDIKYLTLMYSLNMIIIYSIYTRFNPTNITTLWLIYVSSIITRLVEFSGRFICTLVKNKGK